MTQKEFKYKLNFTINYRHENESTLTVSISSKSDRLKLKMRQLKKRYEHYGIVVGLCELRRFYKSANGWRRVGMFRNGPYSMFYLKLR
jgi:hypothetical protein